MAMVDVKEVKKGIKNLVIRENPLPNTFVAKGVNEIDADPMLSKAFSGMDLEEEDPYYDEQKDEKDETWATKNIAGGIDRSSTDAVLNCPCCFTLLCVDCQRHEHYTDQYRAMFVTNCRVNCGVTLAYRPQRKSRNPHKATWERIEVQNTSLYAQQDLYYPVECGNCGTDVAVYDCEEIYHFYNTISGY